jgi:DNA modification methylase
MAGERAVLFSTDPPYSTNYDGTNHPLPWNRRAEKKRSNKDWRDYYHDAVDSVKGIELYDGFIRQAVEHAITPNAAWYCWHASRRQAMLEAVWEKYGAFVHQQIIWVKDRSVLTRSWYLWQHEPCLFGWVRGNRPPRVTDTFESTVWVLDTVRVGQANDHPTFKPIEVFALPMRQHTLPGDVCYEPFCGHGTQIIAGEQLGRRVYGIEINPAFCAASIERWAEATGREPVLTVADQ